MTNNQTNTKIFGLQRNILLILGIIVAFAFVLRFSRCFLVNRIDKDAVLFVQMAQDWSVKGVEYAFDRNPRIPPAYLFIMTCGEWLGVGAENMGKAASVLAGSLLSLAAFMIGMSIFKNDKTALTAAFLVAVQPYLIRISEDVMRDSLFVTFTAFAAAFLLIAVDKNHWWAWCASGFFSAFSIATRTEGIELFIALTAWLVLEIIIRRKETKNILSKVLPGVLLMIICFASFVVPVELALKKSASRWSVLDYRIKAYIDNLSDQEGDNG
jgi:4-amino-4-deoxy-L-arabinose transferase-like glycosyltransferase